MVAVNSRTVYDSVRQLVDVIQMEPDPAVRLHHFAYLQDLWDSVVSPARDKAAYDARSKYPVSRVQEISECDPSSVFYWATRHQKKTGAPPLRRRNAVDLDGAIDLTGLARRSKKEPSSG